jgi:hypothetical protein
VASDLTHPPNKEFHFLDVDVAPTSNKHMSYRLKAECTINMVDPVKTKKEGCVLLQSLPKEGTTDCIEFKKCSTVDV